MLTVIIAALTLVTAFTVLHWVRPLPAATEKVETVQELAARRQREEKERRGILGVDHLVREIVKECRRDAQNGYHDSHVWIDVRDVPSREGRVLINDLNTCLESQGITCTQIEWMCEYRVFWCRF